jgi:SAM-dependent methyltransferase
VGIKEVMASYYTPSVPWVPTRDEVIDYLLKILKPRSGDIVYDVGCGDGRVALALAQRNPQARVKCVEIRSDLVAKARDNAREKGVALEVVEGDFFKLPLKDANIVYMYLLTSVNQKLRPKLEEELRPGTIVVSLDFPIPEWIPLAVVELPRSWQRSLYIYVAGYSDGKYSKEISEKFVVEALERLNLEALPKDVKVKFGRRE